jgi:hypothetical protein
MNAKEVQEKLAQNMKRWQKIENATISQTARAMEQTDNPLLRAVMEIIQRDANTHHRIQQMIIDSLEREALHISPEDIGQLSEAIDRHVKIEKDSIVLAQECLTAIAKSKMVAQKYLITYLLEDEQKHEKLLSDLDLIRRGMYPY